MVTKKKATATVTETNTVSADVAILEKIVKHKIDFILLIEVINGNPNGDPDAANMPRQIVETRKGLISDVCTKRKVRNYIDFKYEGIPGMSIFIRHGVPKDKAQNNAIEEVEKPEKGSGVEGKADYANRLKDWMCKKFWDVRTFGAVCQRFNAKDGGAGVDGSIRGAVQIGLGESIDPVIVQRIGLTSCAVANEKEAASKDNTMGSKYIIPYGLYKVTGHIMPQIAEKNGFTTDDVEKLWDALLHMFEIDHAAGRGDMSVKKLVVMEHETKWGNVFEDEIAEAVTATKKVEIPTSINDYDIQIKEIKGVKTTVLR